jgi:putative peptidoglycan lipid II flippase
MRLRILLSKGVFMESSRQPYATARSATGLTALSVLSPLVGLAVETALAWHFGASATVDAFRVGSLLIFFGQQIFIFQILPNVIVPVFAEHRARGEEQEAWHISFSLAHLFFIPTVLLSLFLFVSPSVIVHFLGPGLVGEARDSAILFVRWFALAYIPLVWSGVAAGVLYAYRIFWLPTASQLLNNALLVIIILVFGQWLGPVSLVLGMLLASVGAGVLYAVRLVLLVRQLRVHYSFRIHAGVRKTFHFALPLLGTLILVQWGGIILNRVLSELPAGTLASFGYAWKMAQIVSLLPAALATVLFPRFAESWHSSQKEFRQVCTRALRMALFIAIPLTCICFFLRVSLVAILFQRGKFSIEAGERVARIFALLLLGAPAYVTYIYLEKMLYAVQEMRVPTYAAAASALFLTATAPVVVRFGAGGVAVVVAVLNWLTAGGVLFILCWKYKAVRMKEMGIFVMGILLLAVAAAGIGGEGGKALGQLIGSRTLSPGLTLAGSTSLAAIIFYGLTLLLRLPEACQGQRYLRWQSDAIIRGVQSAIQRIEGLFA